MSERWKDFTDGEIELIDDAFCELDLAGCVDISAVNALRSEIKDVQRERAHERERATYRGPGYYREVSSGVVMRICGSVAIGNSLYALVGHGATDSDLWGYPMEYLETRNSDGERKFVFSEVQP